MKVGSDENDKVNERLHFSLIKVMQLDSALILYKISISSTESF